MKLIYMQQTISILTTETIKELELNYIITRKETKEQIIYFILTDIIQEDSFN